MIMKTTLLSAVAASILFGCVSGESIRKTQMSIQVEPTENIVEVATKAGTFNSLLLAATQAGLVPTLSDPNVTLTVFAPTDAAFDAVEDLDSILQDTEALKTLLLNHVVPGKVMSTDLMDGMVVEVLGGDKLNVKIDDNGGVMINNAIVTAVDIRATNGVIHVIDQVLTFDASVLDQPLGTIVDVAEANGSFSTLLTAAKEADLVGTLSNPDAMLTVFAPTDAAFDAVEGLDKIIADKELLKSILLNHVADGKVMSGDLSNRMSIPVLGGESIYVGIMGDAVKVNNALVIIADVPASNGVIHVIDAVLSFGDGGCYDDVVHVCGCAADTCSEELCSAKGRFWTYGCSPHCDCEDYEPEIISVEIGKKENLSELSSILSSTGLAGIIDTQPELTLFAPTDAAFAAVEGLDDILSDDQALQGLLFNHGTASKLMSGDLTNGMAIPTIMGEEITVKITDDGVFLNNALVVEADVVATNGVFHVIDAVLEFDNIVEIGTAAGEFTTLLTAAAAAGLVDTLSDSTALITLFAPSDDAFAKIDNIDEILADTDALKTLLLNHVVGGRVMSGNLMDGQVVDALGGGKLNVNIGDKGVMINNAKVVDVDIFASNGVIHVIDTVLTFDMKDGEGMKDKEVVKDDGGMKDGEGKGDGMGEGDGTGEGDGKVESKGASESADAVESKASFLTCAAVSTFSGLVGVVAFL